jgi:hypothetical protein
MLPDTIDDVGLIFVGASPPANPIDGLLWVNLADQLHFSQAGIWVPVAGGGGGGGGTAVPRATAKDQLLISGATPFPWTLTTSLDGGNF